MRRVGFPIGALAAFLVVALGVLSIPKTGCACGEPIPGTVKYHWDEMTYAERARFYVNGYVPFDKTGTRL